MFGADPPPPSADPYSSAPVARPSASPPTCTPTLNSALLAGDLPTIVSLLGVGGSAIRDRVNRVDRQSGESPFHLACLQGSAGAVRAMIAAGANLINEDGTFRQPLHCAAESGDAGTVRALVDAQEAWRAGTTGKLMRMVDKRGLTPVHLAIMKSGGGGTSSSEGEGEREGEAGAEGKEDGEEGGEALLPLVLSFVAETLAQEEGEGGDGVYRCGSATTGAGTATTTNGLLHLAVLRSLQATRAVLAATGANRATWVNMEDAEGKTPLHHACAEGLVEVAAALVGAGANVFAKDG